MFRELEKKNALIDEMNRSNTFSMRSETEFKPLREDLAAKVVRLQSRIKELEAVHKTNDERVKTNSNGVG
jgi:hypothetical protein